MTIRTLLGPAVLLLAAQSALAAPITFDPLHAGTFGAGTGANAKFAQIDSSWHGSTVLWDENNHQYGSGQAIGSFAWGTGIWGRPDWQQTINAATGTGGAGAPTVTHQWSGQVGSINYGNACYNNNYDSTWGAAQALPVANAGNDPCGASGDNWAAYFNGFIRITEDGLYNFSVLYDDGFFFRLIGAGGQYLEIDQDFLNPRDREGFADNLLLSEGLYAFELGSWNRLEAGVVDLRWSRGDDNWVLVPTENLVSSNPVSEPASLALGLLALTGAAASRRRRQPAAA